MFSEAVLKIIGKKLIATLLTALLTLGFFVGINRALAQMEEDIAAEAETSDAPTIPVPAPTKNIKLELENVDNNPNWNRSEALTAGLKFMIRGREALAWVIGINDFGFDTPSLQSSYQTVLTIVNSLFVLGLLGIAAMWMFSLLIPRHRLKKVILVYALAVILVNFALPANRLLIDGTNLLQKTLLTRDDNPIGIVDIVEAPPYAEAIGYTNQLGQVRERKTSTLNLSVLNPTGQNVEVGTINTENIPIGIQGVLGADAVALQAQPAGPGTLTLKTNQTLATQIESEHLFNPNQEQEWFAVVIVALTGLAYLLMALIFLLRLVILWGMLIISPLLVLLAIFQTTRGYFYGWMSLYGRWLLIGPLVALGLSIIISIWQAVGLPLTSNAASGTFGTIANIRFSLPGTTTPNALSTTNEMMQMVLFLIMLYLPIFFGFALTRQKLWTQAAMGMIPERFGREKKGEKPREENPKNPTGTPPQERRGLIAGIKDFVSERVEKITKNPELQRTEMPAAILGASSFLPEQLATASIPDMLELLGANKESRHSRDQALQTLRTPEPILDPAEQKKVTAVREEIETRASRGDPEAIILNNEIQTKNDTPSFTIPIQTPAAEPLNQQTKEPAKTSEPVLEPLKSIDHDERLDENDKINQKDV